jgi:predicted RNA-binding Zn-ribbon protein involved in translation (DUF1610 family)
MTNPIRPTLFQVQADRYQARQNRTKAEGVKAGGAVIMLGLIGFAFFGLLLLLSRRSSLQVIVVICGIAVVAGIVVAIVNAARPLKTATCPKCGATHSIYMNVRKFMCPACRTLLLLGEEPTAKPQIVACPYCGLETAVTSGHGDFLCPDCGMLRKPEPTTQWQSGGRCSACQEPIPANALVCVKCGAIQRVDLDRPSAPGLKYDEDWRIGKSARGHSIYAQVLLMTIRAAHVSVDPNKPYLEQLKVNQSCLERLGNVMLSVEEVTRDRARANDIEKLLPEIDKVYGELITWKATCVSGLMANPDRQRNGFDGYSLCSIEKEPYIAARRRIEDVLGDKLGQDNGIGRWEERLVSVTRDKGHSQITNFRMLAAEATRCKAWLAQEANAVSVPAMPDQA